LLVAVDGSGNIVSPMDGYNAMNSTTRYFAEYYQTTDCTGTPYLLQNDLSGTAVYDYLLGKLGQTSTDFEVKQRNSLRNLGIDHSSPEKAAPEADCCTPLV
jgi:hypothetical protein